MPTRKSPRKGSLQFWPRKRASKFLPRVNWNAIKTDSNSLKGFICYKAGMISCVAKNNTPDAMTKGKRIVLGATVLECPPMKILSVRFYKNGKVLSEVLAENLDKELKRKIKIPKKKTKKIEDVKEYDDIRLVCYSVVKKTNIKKTPDVLEIGLGGSVEDKLNFAKEHVGKEINIFDVFKDKDLVDFRGLTTGKGFSGPVKRFGIHLRHHKSEKGVRKVGSIGPWHPARTTFRTPMAGQLGMFTRAIYNNKIIAMKKAQDLSIENLKNFGKIKTNLILVYGSVQGPSKRALVATHTLRKNKKQSKKDFEFLEVAK